MVHYLCQDSASVLRLYWEKRLRELVSIFSKLLFSNFSFGANHCGANMGNLLTVLDVIKISLEFNRLDQVNFFIGHNNSFFLLISGQTASSRSL